MKRTTVFETETIRVVDNNQYMDYVGYVENLTDHPVIITIEAAPLWWDQDWIDEDEGETEDDYGWHLMEGETEDFTFILKPHKWAGFFANPRQNAWFETLAEKSYTARILPDNYLEGYDCEGEFIAEYTGMAA